MLCPVLEQLDAVGLNKNDRYLIPTNPWSVYLFAYFKSGDIHEMTHIK